MSLSEFINLITLTGAVDDNFGAREIGTIFSISMMTQIDELNKDRHCRMFFVEFLEALCRTADRVISSYPFLSESQPQSVRGGNPPPSSSFASIVPNSGGVAAASSDRYHTPKSAKSAESAPFEYKINQFVRRIALNCMGDEYATQYLRREAAREAARKAAQQKSKLREYMPATSPISSTTPRNF
jgi:hypothetical protein